MPGAGNVQPEEAAWQFGSFFLSHIGASQDIPSFW
jgi:hypothetical protein